MNRPLLLVLLASFLGFTTFFLMLGVTPLFAVDEGYGTSGAALTTAVFMLATVLGELVTTRIMARIGSSKTLALGLVLMNVPLFALLLDGSMPTIVTVGIVRGFGFAFLVIASGTMVAALAQEGKRGESIGLYGVVIGVPSIFALPSGVWLVEQIGYAPLFIAAGSTAVFALVIAVGRIHIPAPETVTGMMHALRSNGVLRLAIIFAVTTLASGLLITYLPLDFEPGVAALALLVMGLAATVTRWFAGRYADRRDSRILIVPALALAAIGLVIVLFAAPLVIVSALVIVGSLVFGLAFGVLQNTTIHLMLDSTGPSGYGAVNAIWNVAYNVGVGIGALSFALLSAPQALVVAASLLVAAIVLSAVARRRGSSQSSHVTAG